MDWSTLWQQIVLRLSDNITPADTTTQWAPVAFIIGLAAVVVRPIWRIVRTLVTIVHELGHALVGLACGRRFTGFVVNTDMSGHTVTAGKSRGIGLVFTTAAGYPMPAIIGAVVIQAGLAGFSGIVLLAFLIALVVALIHARSLFTVFALVVLVIADAALWWHNDDAMSATVVSTLGVILLAGAWRQLVNVIAHGDGRQDPQILRSLTRIPAGFWNIVFVAIVAAATWWAGLAVAPWIATALGQ